MRAGKGNKVEYKYKLSDRQKNAVLIGLIASFLLLFFTMVFEEPLRKSEYLPGEVLYALLQSASVAFMSGIFVFLVVDKVFFQTNIEIYKEHMEEVIEKKLKETGLAPHGVREIHSRMPRDKIDSIISELSPSDELMILQTYSDGLVSISSGLTKFFKSGGKARALLLDPRSDIVSLRSNQLRDKQALEYALSICENIRKLSSIGDENIKICLYNEIPWFGLYGHKENMFLMMYSSTDYGVNNPNIEVFPGTLMKFLVKNFEEMWCKSEVFNINEIETIREEAIEKFGNA